MDLTRPPLKNMNVNDKERISASVDKAIAGALNLIDKAEPGRHLELRQQVANKSNHII